MKFTSHLIYPAQTGATSSEKFRRDFERKQMDFSKFPTHMSV